jgi:hypothetical protein
MEEEGVCWVINEGVVFGEIGGLILEVVVGVEDRIREREAQHDVIPEQCLGLFNDRVHQLNDGRERVLMPFKDKHTPLFIFPPADRSGDCGHGNGTGESEVVSDGGERGGATKFGVEPRGEMFTCTVNQLSVK